VHGVDYRAAAGAARRESKIDQRPERSAKILERTHMLLSPSIPPRTSAPMPKPLFDYALRAQRRDRAAAAGPALFLYDRVFADILERLVTIRRHFRSALLIGAPDPAWPGRLATIVKDVTVMDPGGRMAAAAGGAVLTEDRDRLPGRAYDLCVAIGTLDTVNDLPLALANIRDALKPGSLFIGAISGGETLPRLRAAMLAGDQAAGVATPHVHPRIDGPSLCALLAKTGFSEPVVDIDRVPVSYPSLAALVADLRAMAVTNILADRSKSPFGRGARTAAIDRFNDFADGERVTETFEILHFASWAASEI
jgi:hypothetical protein